MSAEATQPAFRRVWSDLRGQILRQEFPADRPLPTEAEIARKYSISRQTVRRAFQDLVAEDLVYRVPGRGTFVTSSSGRYLRQFGSVEELMALSADTQLQVLQPLTSGVDVTAAARLRLPDDRIASAAFLRLHQGDPFSHSTVYLPPAVRARLAEVPELETVGTISAVTVIGLLDRVLQSPIRDAEQSITVADAPFGVASTLDLPVGSPVLRIDRMYFDSDEKPVELAVSHFHPGRYSYRTKLRRGLA